MHFICAKHGYICLFAGWFEGFEFKEYNGSYRLGSVDKRITGVCVHEGSNHKVVFIIKLSVVQRHVLVFVCAQKYRTSLY